MDNQNEMLEAVQYIGTRLLDISISLKETNYILKNLDKGISNIADSNIINNRRISKALDKLENRFAKTHWDKLLDEIDGKEG